MGEVGTKPGTLTFRHDVIAGTPYEVGVAQGRAMAGAEWRGAFRAGPPGIERYSADEGKTALRVVERHCPTSPRRSAVPQRRRAFPSSA